MPGPVTDAHPDTHTDAHTDRIIYPDAERVTDQGAHMDRIPNDLVYRVYRAVNAWWGTSAKSDGERDAERDLICACRDLLAYVDGEQQRDSDVEPDAIRRAYRLGWEAGIAAGEHRSQ